MTDLTRAQVEELLLSVTEKRLGLAEYFAAVPALCRNLLEEREKLHTALDQLRLANEDAMIEAADAAGQRERADENAEDAERLASELSRQREMWGQLPSGIDPDAEEDDPTPDDMSAHLGGLAVRYIGAALAAHEALKEKP